MQAGGQLVNTYRGHELTVMSVQIVDKRIVSASGDQTIKIWNIQQGHCEATLQKHREVVMSVRADHQKIISGSADKHVIVWDFLRA